MEGEYDVWCCVGTAAISSGSTTALPCWAVAFSPSNVAVGFPAESQTALCRGGSVHSNNPGEADALSDPRLMTVVDRKTPGTVPYSTLSSLTMHALVLAINMWILNDLNSVLGIRISERVGSA